MCDAFKEFSLFQRREQDDDIRGRVPAVLGYPVPLMAVLREPQLLQYFFFSDFFITVMMQIEYSNIDGVSRDGEFIKKVGLVGRAEVTREKIEEKQTQLVRDTMVEFVPRCAA